MAVYDLIVIGGGPAGLAAALGAWEAGVRSIVILERDNALGGILNQCIHSGFGLHRFQQELTGPEYAQRYIEAVNATGIEKRTDAMVLDITADKTVHFVSPKTGYETLQAKAIVLAMGCRERTRGAISIPGHRPAGVFTAGAAQRYVNIEGKMVGRRVLVLGSGDIGLIMARRMTLEGAKVVACVELLPYSGGLTRNIVQCLEDYGIPLLLSHTVTDIEGEQRVQRVTVSAVDQHRKPISGTEQVFEVDTILLSVGLIPENELTKAAGIALDPRTGGPTVYENMETSQPGVFACGNVVQVHDLVDFVSAESERAGKAAARYIQMTENSAKTQEKEMSALEVVVEPDIAYTVPQRIRLANVEQKLDIFFRVRRPIGHKCKVVVRSGAEQAKPLAAFPRERLAPGEMERITLPKALLQRAAGGELRIEIEETPEMPHLTEQTQGDDAK